VPGPLVSPAHSARTSAPTVWRAGCLTAQRLVIAGEPGQVSTARAFVNRVLESHCEVAATVALLTSELVTNSIKHSDSRNPGGTIVVTVVVTADRVHVEVHDGGGATEPRLRPGDDLAECGRGLQLVEACSLSWDYHRTETGTITWFECSLDPS
jgi:anti-sigma regulatory factor (Ser/Thr protein kinase)